jgi:hypothetical protein
MLEFWHIHNRGSSTAKSHWIVAKDWQHAIEIASKEAGKPYKWEQLVPTLNMKDILKGTRTGIMGRQHDGSGGITWIFRGRQMDVQEFFRILENQTQIAKYSTVKKYAKQIVELVAVNHTKKPILFPEEAKGFVVNPQQFDSVTVHKYKGYDEIHFNTGKTFTATYINSEYDTQPWFGVFEDYFIVNSANEPGVAHLYRMRKKI